MEAKRGGKSHGPKERACLGLRNSKALWRFLTKHPLLNKQIHIYLKTYENVSDTDTKACVRITYVPTVQFVQQDVMSRVAPVVLASDHILLLSLFSSSRGNYYPEIFLDHSHDVLVVYYICTSRYLALFCIFLNCVYMVQSYM